MKKTRKEPGLEIHSPCTALELRRWLTKTSKLVQPSSITEETRKFLKKVEWEAYEGNVLWEFTPTRFMILFSLLRKAGRARTYNDVWPYLLMLSMPYKVAKHIRIDFENGRFTGLPGLAKLFGKKGTGRCT